MVALGRAGIGRIIVHPFAASGSTVEATIRSLAQDVAPRARTALGGSSSA